MNFAQTSATWRADQANFTCIEGLKNIQLMHHAAHHNYLKILWHRRLQSYCQGYHAQYQALGARSEGAMQAAPRAQ